jgi:hypothetical protein
MFKKSFSIISILFLFLILVFSVSAQKKKPKTNTKKVPSTQAKATPTPEETPTPEKKNSRPADENSEGEENEKPEAGKKNSKPENSNSGKTVKQAKSKSVYFYEFSRPEFNVEKIFIEHDENGKGTIRFSKKFYDEEISDPIALSPAYSEKIKTIWQNLNFLDSTENYQYEKDYSHLGNMKFTMKKDGRERTTEFNWTTNKDAKALSDEYRKIGNKYVWIFDINLSRENQPLESAKLMDALDSQIRRDEIADLEQMIPFLKELSDDERMPLISRNHAARIVKEIEKKMEKEKEEN